jgi:hypothetical protein
MADSLDPAIGHLLRELAPQVLGGVARRQDALAESESKCERILLKQPKSALPLPRSGSQTASAL